MATLGRDAYSPHCYGHVAVAPNKVDLVVWEQVTGRTLGEDLGDLSEVTAVHVDLSTNRKVSFHSFTPLVERV